MYDQARYPWPDAATALVVPMLQWQQAAPEAFLEHLAAIAREQGGWAAYGAERLMIDVAGGDLSHPAYSEVMDASLAFLRASGVPPVRVTGYEWQHWINSGGTTETWVKRRPTPTEAEAPIASLAVGEERRLAQLTAESWSNVFIVRRDDHDRYSWIVDARRNDEDLRRAQRVHETAGSLYELYVRIGLSLQVPPYWYDDELGPYIPLPEPAL